MQITSTKRQYVNFCGQYRIVNMKHFFFGIFMETGGAAAK